MSTRECEVMDVDTMHPSTSLALVPLTVEERPMRGAALPDARPGRIHRYFYGLGYAGLALLVLGTWIGARSAEAMAGAYIVGAAGIGFGGLGGLVHLLVKPRTMHKLRTVLGAIAALGLTCAALPAIGRAAVEVNAASRIPGLQPLAESLARHGRIHEMESRDGFKRFNGFSGLDRGPDVVRGRAPGVPYSEELEDVLRRDGVTRGELAALERRMGAAGMEAVKVENGHVLFRAANADGWRLLYVLPGDPLPARSTSLDGWRRWRTEPLGGGWYVVRNGSR